MAGCAIRRTDNAETTELQRDGRPDAGAWGRREHGRFRGDQCDVIAKIALPAVRQVGRPLGWARPAGDDAGRDLTAQFSVLARAQSQFLWPRAGAQLQLSPDGNAG